MTCERPSARGLGFAAWIIVGLILGVLGLIVLSPIYAILHPVRFWRDNQWPKGPVNIGS